MTVSPEVQNSIDCWVDLFGAANSARSARISVVHRAELFLRLGLIELEGSYGVLDALKVDREGWDALVVEAADSAAAGQAFGAARDAERRRVREMERQLALREVKGGGDD